MKKLLASLVLIVLSANFASAEEYIIVHRPGIGEALGSAAANIVMLPIAVVGGFAGGVVKGFAGSDERVLVNQPQTSYTTTTYTIPPPMYMQPMYMQPMYIQPPIVNMRFNGGGGHRGGHHQGDHRGGRGRR